MTLSPNYPSVYLGTLGDAYRQAGRTDHAIATFEAYHARNPDFELTDVVIAYQEKSQPEEAKRTAARLMAARPEFTIAGWRKTQFIRRDAARVEADAAALRAAGLPPWVEDPPTSVTAIRNVPSTSTSGRSTRGGQILRAQRWIDGREFEQADQCNEADAIC